MLQSLYTMCFTFPSFKTFFFFFVSLCKVLLEPTWETFSACLVVLDNFCEVFGCSVITDSISTVVAFLQSFWLLSNFLLVYWFCVFLSYKCLIIFLTLQESGVFPVNLIENNCKSFFIMFNWMITVFFRKSNAFIIVFEDKIADFIDWHLSIELAIFGIYTIILRKQKRKTNMIL